jgi:hypothetical protein
MRTLLARNSAPSLSIDDERTAKSTSRPQLEKVALMEPGTQWRAIHADSVTFGTESWRQTFCHEVSTPSGIRGHPEEASVKKARLLSTVAAALLFGVGAVSAQGMSKDTPERAPAAQQSAPAEKVAPSMKNGDHKAPQTTGQATPDNKPGAAKETTGQAPKSEPKSDKSDMGQRPQESSPANGGVSKSNSDNSPASPSAKSTSEQNRATTGQGAAGSAKLTTEQRTKISSVIKEQKVERVNLNVSVNVGTRIPASVHVHPLPQQVIVIYPEWRGYDYILVGEQIVIINPRTHEIVAIIEA